jgi:hypothetical protein
LNEELAKSLAGHLIADVFDGITMETIKARYDSHGMKLTPDEATELITTAHAYVRSAARFAVWVTGS